MSVGPRRRVNWGELVKGSNLASLRLQVYFGLGADVPLDTEPSILAITGHCNQPIAPRDYEVANSSGHRRHCT